MMKALLNNKGGSLIGILLTCVIILIVAVVGMKLVGSRIKGAGKSATGKNINSPSEAKGLAMGSACSSAINSLGQTAEMYRVEQGQIPQTMSQLTDIAPQLSTSISDSALWVQDGNPVYESAIDKYSITGYCVDGNMYVYTSDANTVSSQPFEK